MKDSYKVITGLMIWISLVLILVSQMACREVTLSSQGRPGDGMEIVRDSLGNNYLRLFSQNPITGVEGWVSENTLLELYRDSISGGGSFDNQPNLDSLAAHLIRISETEEGLALLNDIFTDSITAHRSEIEIIMDSMASHRFDINSIEVASSTTHIIGSNLALGTSAGVSAAGANGIFMGVLAGANAANKPYMIGIGYNAARYADVEDGIFIGRVSGLNATGGTDNTMVGSRSFENGDGDRNTAMGRDAFRDARVDNSVAFGYNAGQNVDSAIGGTFIGHQSGSDSRGVDNTIVGNVSGRYIHGNNNTSIGARSFSYDTTSNIYHSTSIGAYTRVDKPNQMALGQDTLDELKIGETFRIKIDTNYANTGFGIGWNNSKGQFVPYNLVYISGQGMQVANNVISLGGDSSGSPTVINSRRYISTQSGAGSIILTGGGGILLAGAADRTAAGLIDAAGTVSAYKLQSTGLTSSYPRISTNTQSSSTVGYIDVARDDNTTNPRDLRFRRAQVEKFGIEGDLEAYDDLDMNSNDLFGVDVLTASTVNISSVIQLTPLADPPTPSEGMIYADTDNHLYYYDGTTWKQLDN